jgi:hypothetical protein
MSDMEGHFCLVWSSPSKYSHQILEWIPGQGINIIAVRKMETKQCIPQMVFLLEMNKIMTFRLSSRSFHSFVRPHFSSASFWKHHFDIDVVNFSNLFHILKVISFVLQQNTWNG